MGVLLVVPMGVVAVHCTHLLPDSGAHLCSDKSFLRTSLPPLLYNDVLLNELLSSPCCCKRELQPPSLPMQRLELLVSQLELVNFSSHSIVVEEASRFNESPAKVLVEAKGGEVPVIAALPEYVIAGCSIEGSCVVG